MSVLENKLVPVDYDGNGTTDLGFLRPILPGSPSGTLQAQLGVWLVTSTTFTQSTVGDIFPYANGSFALLGDGYIPGFSGSVNLLFNGPAPLFPDFNGDGKTDQIFGSLVYTNPTDDTTFEGYELATWFMNGTAVLEQQPIFNPDGSSIAVIPEEWADPDLYSIGGQGPLGDFNGDGTTDALFVRLNGSGTTSVGLWLIDNGTAVTKSVIGDAGVNWSLVNTNDFNGDGTTDLSFTQPGDGGTTNIGVWTLAGTTISKQAVVGAAGAGWSVVDTNDFNGDGKADFLFQQDGGGGNTNVAVWTMNGTEVIGQAVVGVATAGWGIIDHNDFNGDGKADLLFSRDMGGGAQEYAVWLLNGTGSPIAQQIVGTSGSGWEYSGSGDVTGNDIADLAFYNDTTKQIGVWLFSSSGTPVFKGAVATYDNPSSPVGWEPPFTQPGFDIPPFPVSIPT